MKTWLFIVPAVLFVTLCSPVGWSIENPAIGNPIGSSTVPPSSVRSGLLSTPDPIDTSGNLLITGNVRHGRHFRGTVPYRSTTSFGSSLGSSSLSSFLRDTAGSEDFGRYSYTYRAQPYYSQSETVTTMVPGRPGVFRPTSTRISTRAQQDTGSAGADVFGLESLPREQISSGRGTAVPDLGLLGPQTQYTPLAESRVRGFESDPTLGSTLPTGTSLNPRDAERLGPGEIGIRRQGENLAVERFREQVQDVRGKTQDKTTVLGLEPGVLDPERQQDPSEKDAPFRYLDRGTSVEDPRLKFEPQIPAESTTAVKQTAAARYRLPSLDEFSPSVDPESQKDLILQKGTNWPATSKGLQTVQERPARGTLESLEAGRPDTTSQLSTGSRLIGTGQDQEQRDVLGRIKQQLDDLTMSVEAGLQTEPDLTREAGSAEPALGRDETRSGTQPYMLYSREAARRGRIDSSSALSLYAPRRVESGFKEELAPATTGGVLGQADDGKQTRFEFPEIPSYESSQERSSPLDELSKLSQADLSAEAKRIMGPHKSRESFSDAKFNQHMQAAEDHLKAGRYYRAADSFALASIYEASDPRPLAGKGHALFAAGEYVSSALFLSRALAMGPEYAQTKIDLVAMLGGENKLASRVADVEQWLARSSSTELLFLLSYVHYRTGRLARAKQAIEAAYEKVPQSPAVQALRTAIDDATTKP